jgi:hypothetical protein
VPLPPGGPQPSGFTRWPTTLFPCMPSIKTPMKPIPWACWPEVPGIIIWAQSSQTGMIARVQMGEHGHRRKHLTAVDIQPRLRRYQVRVQFTSVQMHSAVEFCSRNGCLCHRDGTQSRIAECTLGGLFLHRRQNAHHYVPSQPVAAFAAPTAAMAGSAGNPLPEQQRYGCDCEILVGGSRASPRLP